LGYESTRYNKSVDKVQKRSGLNIVNLDGEAHMMSGVYMIDGVLTSRCFGCGELSDRCLCTVFDNDYIPGVEIDGLSGRSFQFRNSIPKIKGISGQSDYVIMFLDSNKKKKNEEEHGDHQALCISRMVHQASSSDENVKSGQISGFPGIQESANIPEHSGSEISGAISVHRCPIDDSGIGRRTDYCTSSGLGFGYSTIVKSDEEKESSNVTRENSAKHYNETKQCSKWCELRRFAQSERQFEYGKYVEDGKKEYKQYGEKQQQKSKERRKKKKEKKKKNQ